LEVKDAGAAAPAALSGQRRGERNPGKAAAAKGGGGFDTDKGFFFAFYAFSV